MTIHALTQMPARDLDRQLRMARDAGATVVRFDVGWSSLQQRSARVNEGWYLERMDRLVRTSRHLGLDLVANFTSTPCWASKAPARLRQGCRGAWWTRRVTYYPPRRAQRFAAAAAFLARRYRGRIAAWELWNEPNIRSFMVARHPARAYARIVRATYPAIKRADPSTTVLAGSTAGADITFLRRFYRHARGQFDGISIHPYSGYLAPDNPYTGLRRQISDTRRLMVQKGDARKGLWLTEFGWSTCAWAPGRRRDCVNRGVQAHYVVRALSIIKSFSYVRAATYYLLRDNGTDPRDLLDNFGLLTLDYRPKPAYAAFRSVARGF